MGKRKVRPRDLLSDGGGGAERGGNFKTHPPKCWENPRTQNCPTPTGGGGGGCLDTHPPKISKTPTHPPPPVP